MISNPIPKKANPIPWTGLIFSLKIKKLRIAERKIAPPNTIGETIATLFVAKALLSAMVKKATPIPANTANIMPVFEFVITSLFIVVKTTIIGIIVERALVIAVARVGSVLRDAYVPSNMTAV